VGNIVWTSLKKKKEKQAAMVLVCNPSTPEDEAGVGEDVRQHNEISS
jgi:hypothetical protein